MQCLETFFHFTDLCILRNSNISGKWIQVKNVKHEKVLKHILGVLHQCISAELQQQQQQRIMLQSLQISLTHQSNINFPEESERSCSESQKTAHKNALTHISVRYKHKNSMNIGKPHENVLCCCGRNNYQANAKRS